MVAVTIYEGGLYFIVMKTYTPYCSRLLSNYLLARAIYGTWFYYVMPLINEALCSIF